MSTSLYYIHDPMCSWCWGFRPTLDRLLADLPGRIRVERLLGGLAPDSDAPMPPNMRVLLQQTWRNIAERIPGTRFNHDFWTSCEPRRSTYPACRAVIAARAQDPRYDLEMTHAIQRAYYLEARNPSDRDTLIALAEGIGADTEAFESKLDAPDTQTQLEWEIETSRAMGASGFPSLILDQDGSRWRIPVDYSSHRPVIETISQLT